MLSIFPQANGRSGVTQTLDRIASLVHRSMVDGNIRDQAAYAISGCGKADRRCMCAAMLAWVNQKIQYVRDPASHELSYELVHDPRLMAKALTENKRVYGDCDDMAGYLSALLASVGLKPTLRAVGYNGGTLSHVYVVCEGVPLDPTRDAWSVTYQPHRETDVMERRI